LGDVPAVLLLGDELKKRLDLRFVPEGSVVRSPRIASNATFALNAALRRFRSPISLASNPFSKTSETTLITGPNFGEHYTMNDSTINSCFAAKRSFAE